MMGMSRSVDVRQPGFDSQALRDMSQDVMMLSAELWYVGHSGQFMDGPELGRALLGMTGVCSSSAVPTRHRYK
jgi:hypothetical protein